MASTAPFLNIHILSGKQNQASSYYLIFDEREAAALRSSTYRIFANYIGTRTKPATLGNNNPVTIEEKDQEDSLPLQLTQLEVCHLVDAYPNQVNLWRTLDFDEKECDFASFESSFNDYQTRFRESQIEEYRNKRIEELEAKKEKILSGKRDKLNKRIKDIDDELKVSLTNQRGLHFWSLFK